MNFNFIDKKYYQYKIVVTFLIVTILLVAVLAKVSYDFMYDFYLNQLTENVKQTTNLTVSKIEDEYINILQNGILTETTKEYFSDFLQSQEFDNIYSELFLFDKNLNTIVHSDSKKLVNTKEPKLFLNETEIFELQNNSITVSLPFKGNDNNWYLWGFYRFSDDYWLAVRASAVNFESIDNLTKTILLFGLIGVMVSTLLGLWISKSITKPITKLVNFSSGIGKGNLYENPPKKMKGELKILSDALVLMRDNIANNQKEKEKILAQIAHEIRNPLGGIELLTSLIHESFDQKDKNKEYASKILNELSGLKELITSYLNYSRPTPANPEKIKIKELINEVIVFVQKEIEEKSLKVKLDLKSEKIYFDKIHLRNIFLNLLKNSIDSIDKNGEIIIESFMKGRNTIIKISDNGFGIENENLEKIFEPFFTTKNNGTGLGLASCKKFCEENSAKIFAENLTKGCSFTIIR
ncbi:MAG: HAMP domain-containing histidine kinase [Ignavibacteriales bacterium]|nr:HAMP domain-containing histidine kinase [Ignavibacteriales bacterium]